MNLGGGDSTTVQAAPAPSPGETTENMLKGMISAYPEYLKMIQSQIPGMEQLYVDIQKRLAPQQAQTQLDLYKQYGPAYNEIGNQIAAENAIAQAEREKQLMTTSGGDLARQTLAVQKELDPVFYGAQEAAGKSIQSLLSSFGNIEEGLSGAERAETERGINRENISRGTSQSPSQIETLSAANQMGSAVREKQTALGNALNVASNFLQMGKSGVDVGSLVLNKPIQSNTGENRFSNVQPLQSANTTTSTASDLLAQIGQNQRAVTSANATPLSKSQNFNMGFLQI